MTKAFTEVPSLLVTLSSLIRTTKILENVRDKTKEIAGFETVHTLAEHFHLGADTGRPQTGLLKHLSPTSASTQLGEAGVQL